MSHEQPWPEKSEWSTGVFFYWLEVIFFRENNVPSYFFFIWCLSTPLVRVLLKTTSATQSLSLSGMTRWTLCVSTNWTTSAILSGTWWPRPSEALSTTKSAWMCRRWEDGHSPGLQQGPSPSLRGACPGRLHFNLFLPATEFLKLMTCLPNSVIFDILLALFLYCSNVDPNRLLCKHI